MRWNLGVIVSVFYNFSLKCVVDPYRVFVCTLASYPTEFFINIPWHFLDSKIGWRFDSSIGRCQSTYDHLLFTEDPVSVSRNNKYRVVYRIRSTNTRKREQEIQGSSLRFMGSTHYVNVTRTKCRSTLWISNPLGLENITQRSFGWTGNRTPLCHRNNTSCRLFRQETRTPFVIEIEDSGKRDVSRNFSINHGDEHSMHLCTFWVSLNRGL